MKFQVPQFIETESKVVGQFTLKQFLYLAAGAIVIYVFRYIFSTFFLWVIVSLPVAILAAGLAFFKIDVIPLPNFLIMALSFAVGNKKYIYQKKEDNDPELENTLQDLKSDK